MKTALLNEALTCSRFLKPPDNSKQESFPSPVKRCHFTPDFSESRIFDDSTAVILECNKTGGEAT